jgi:hypothetical protein
VVGANPSVATNLIDKFHKEQTLMIQKLKVKIPEGQGRIETGTVQFNDDWPGYFIRGDNFAMIQMDLMHLESEIEKLSPMAQMAFRSLKGLLEDEDTIIKPSS